MIRENIKELSQTLIAKSTLKDLIYRVIVETSHDNPKKQFEDNLFDIKHRLSNEASDLERDKKWRTAKGWEDTVNDFDKIIELLSDSEFVDEYVKKHYKDGQMSKLRPEITNENIAEYYPTMNEGDMRKYAYMYSESLKIAKREVESAIFSDLLNDDMSNSAEAYNDKKEASKEHIDFRMYANSFMIELVCFGVKYNLQPIDEYVAEVRASDEYKKFIIEKKGESELTNKNINADMYYLKDYVSPEQFLTTIAGGEEMYDTVAKVVKQIKATPDLYEQDDGKGDDAIVYLHYFNDDSDWYITEFDKEDKNAHGYLSSDKKSKFEEWGNFNLYRIESVGAELDYNWTPKTLKEVKDD